MPIPIDQLYNFLSQHINDDVVIYNFCPAGSKKLQNIKPLLSDRWFDYDNKDWIKRRNWISFLFHDQEPLHFDLYQQHDLDDLYIFYSNCYPGFIINLKKFGTLEKYLEKAATFNLNLTKGYSIADRWMLCHSEINSDDLEKYQNIGAVGVYWWSHAMIARDWYRYAANDWKLRYNINNHRFDKVFNIYSRSWTGSREYRLKLTEMILSQKLNECSQIKFSPWDQDLHYSQHKFKNTKFQITSNLECLPLNLSPSTFSADYDADDYRACAIDIVLETLFDDQRWHLTEKTLRPIACGKPFILAATKGSLEYLRRYGFKTFDKIIDEWYDQIDDPLKRLTAIVGLMQKINDLPDQQKKTLFIEMHAIAKYNQDLFWSDGFQQRIVQEFIDNYQEAYQQCQQSKHGKNFIEFRKFTSLNEDYRKFNTSDNSQRTRKELMILLKQIRSTW